MPIVRDFRNYSFDPARVDRCGKLIGRRSYWKLYAVENLLRVFIHSVLSAQISAQWWDVGVDPEVRERAARFRRQYERRPSHTSPGRHDIYLVYLSDLNKIMAANSNLIVPVVPDIDNWIAKIEEIRIARNLVGHMNFPGEIDRRSIDRFYAEAPALIRQLESHLLPVQIP